MHFVAIDVETANYTAHSICQIGIVEYKQGEISTLWSSLLNPLAQFNSFNINIHGITQKMVQGCPTFQDIYPELLACLSNKTVVSHTSFDKKAINTAAIKNHLTPPACTWLDSTLIAKRTWLQFSRSGFGLGNLCQFLNYRFKHHDALEDARACAFIVSQAMQATGFSVEDWLREVKEPLATFRAKN